MATDDSAARCLSRVRSRAVAPWLGLLVADAVVVLTAALVGYLVIPLLV